MKNNIFRPRYSFKSLLDVITLSLLLFFALIFDYLKHGFSLVNLFGWIFLIIFVFWVSHFLVRRIIFSESTFCVEWYTWRSKTIKYSDIIDIGKVTIKTQKSNISFVGMSNAPDLISQFNKLIKQSKINQNQIENKVIQQEVISRKSFLPTLVITFILCALVLYFWPYSRSNFRDLLGLGVSLFTIYLLTNLVIRWIIKKAG